MQSAFRFNGKEAYISDDLNPDTALTHGNAKIDMFMRQFNETSLPSMYGSVPKLASNQNFVLNADATKASLRRTMKVADHLVGVGAAKIIAGDASGFDTDQVRKMFEEFSGVFGSLDTGDYKKQNPLAGHDELDNAKHVELMKSDNYGLNILMNTLTGINFREGGATGPLMPASAANNKYGLPALILGSQGERPGQIADAAGGALDAFVGSFKPGGALYEAPRAAAGWVTGAVPKAGAWVTGAPPDPNAVVEESARSRR
jgi:hypothetical protein